MMENLQNILILYPLLNMLIASELFLIICRNAEIIILIKRPEQRTDEENNRIDKGLLRTILLELLLFVPVSVLLFRLTLFPVFLPKFISIYHNKIVCHSILGIIAYGFPYSSIKNVIAKIAKNTIKEFYEMNSKSKDNL